MGEDTNTILFTYIQRFRGKKETKPLLKDEKTEETTKTTREKKP